MEDKIDPIELLKQQSRDSKKWSMAFCQTTGFYDIDWCHTWFANAMMSMSDSIHNNEIKKLSAKVALYEKALEIYASRLNINCDSGVVDFVCEDGGEEARQALEQGKGEI